MLQQPTQQRIGPGATARVHSRASSKASVSTDGVVRGGLGADIHRAESPKDSTKSDKPALSRGLSLATTISVDSLSRYSGEGGETWQTSAPAETTGRHRDIEVVEGPVGFPPRPAQHTSERGNLRLQVDKVQATPARSEPRQQSFDAPAESLVYPQGKSVDYNPWLGDQPEDNLSEQTVKTGFQNKPSITNESNTARPSLWTHLKNKPGITTLSNLFVAVLEKRQSSGRIAAPSTFKPPPRLSLTNTKREAWLSDLANPACALRRFNRTIPYGINGKGLLEQCLAKEIPTARAVWLIRCVGANELRTLKRKGISGALGASAEHKWIREWTMHVEQFIEATIATCGEKAWKDKIQYVIRLTYHLYVEQLLDTDHFVDWILLSLESTGAERIPLWLVHVQLYWRYLVCSRRRGRRLAEALCVHLKALNIDQANSDIVSPVISKLQVLLSLLANSHRSCLIMPDSWSEHEKRIQTLSMYKSLKPAVANIVERNNRIAKPLWSQGASPSLSPRRRAFQILDAIDCDVSIPEICSKLFVVVPDVMDIVQLVLQWCSSVYRTGTHRIYLSSRILRRCGVIGADIENCVLAFLLNPPSGYSVAMDGVTRVVAELVRSKSFAVLKVLRAVIARGAMTNNDLNPQVASSRLRCLVQNLPTIGLPQHVEDLQHNLLHDVERCAAQEAALRHIYQALDQIFAQANVAKPVPCKRVLSSLEPLTLADKFKVSAHVRLEVLRCCKSLHVAPEIRTVQDTTAVLTLQMFTFVRDVLETLQDIPILADVVGICIQHGHHDTLVAAVDTIQFHKRSLAAIGALRPLAAEAAERYQAFRADLPLSKSYIISLSRLVQSVQGEESSLFQQLKYDLARYDQRNVIAMCSPASDNAMDIVASSSLDTEEEIERVLTSGTTMDEHSLRRVFLRISILLSRPDSFVRADWFSRLRSFDETTFDGLMTPWITKLLHLGNIDTALIALPLLLDAEVITFQTLHQDVCSMQEGNDIQVRELQPKLSAIAIHIFLLGDLHSDNTTLPHSYKLRLDHRNWQSAHKTLVIDHLSRALQAVDNDTVSSDMDRLSACLNSSAIGGFILDALITSKSQVQALAQMLTSHKSAFQTGFRIFRNIVENLLYTEEAQKKAASSDYDSLPQLIRMTCELSLPLCQLEMQMLLAGHSRASEPSHETAGLLFEAIMRSADTDQPPWLELMDGLDPGLLDWLRTKAEQQALKFVNDCLTRLRSEAGQFDHSQVVKAQAILRKLLCVIDSTIKPFSLASPTSPQTILEFDAATAERFGTIKDILMRHYSTEAGVVAERRVCEMTSPLLDTLMRLIAIRKILSDGHKLGSADVASILPILFAIFSQIGMGRVRGTAELLYDTAAYLSDDLTDEYRSLLLRSESPKYPNNPYISFILGSSVPTDTSWLGLATTNQAPLSAQSYGISTPPTSTAARLPPVPQQQQLGGSRLQPPGRPPTPGQRLMTGTQQTQQQQQQGRSFNPPVPFPLRRWELFPDQGSSTTANDTAISLSLVGARKV